MAYLRAGEIQNSRFKVQGSRFKVQGSENNTGFFQF
jgi:hypothetical protein